MTFPQSIKHNQAIELILKQLESKALATEVLPLKSILGRVLAQTIIAPIDVPAFHCSQMDGYAINLECLELNKRAGAYLLDLSEPIHATIQEKPVSCAQRAVPIMTGGLMPVDANAIIIKEHGTVKGKQLTFTKKPVKGQYIRKPGSDLKQGSVVLEIGQSLTAAHLGLLASLGLGEVEVLKQPQVALMMTGDELVQPGQKCLPGQIYEANTFMLSALLSKMGCAVSVLNVLTDSKEVVRDGMNSIKHQNYDLIISVGGVSMGEKDWIAPMLEEQGQVVFHKVKIKPGFPMIFGRLQDTLFYGLPGNPVSAYTTLCQYVFPAIQRLIKQSRYQSTVCAKLTHDLIKTHDRREYLRGFYEMDHHNGSVNVSVCGEQQSSRIESIAQANCFIVLCESDCEMKDGDAVKIQPFEQFYL